MSKTKKITILGAGLSGLAIAFLLEKKGIDVQIIEARDRIGGRILTIKGNQETPIEMGATWFGKKHKKLVAFLEEINVGYYRQYIKGKTYFETMSFAPPQVFEIPDSEEPTYRIKGGTQKIIERVFNELQTTSIHLNQEVNFIEKKEGKIFIKTKSEDIFQSEILISTIPPKLFYNNIITNPSLPENTLEVFEHTQIWMENSIKFAVEYERPFWRENGQSGSVFSQSSIIPEMYDHTNFEENKFALKGFLSGSVIHFPKEKREEAVINTLVKFLGEKAKTHIGYFDKIWEKETHTFSPSPMFLPGHQNNGHPIYQKSYWKDSLFFAGTETSPIFGGYMEGAIQSAYNVVGEIM